MALLGAPSSRPFTERAIGVLRSIAGGKVCKLIGAKPPVSNLINVVGRFAGARALVLPDTRPHAEAATAKIQQLTTWNRITDTENESAFGGPRPKPAEPA